MGKLTVVGAFDALTVRSFPAIHPVLCIAARVRFAVYELGKHAVRVDIVNAAGERLCPPLEGAMAINVIGTDSSCANLPLTLINVRLEREGSWRVSLSVDGDEKATVPLYVRLARPGAQAPAG